MSIDGSWDVTFTTTAGETKERWDITAVDGEVRLRGTSDDSPPIDVVLHVQGGSFGFEVPVPGVPFTLQIAGQRDGDRLTGTGKVGPMPVGTFVGIPTA